MVRLKDLPKHIRLPITERQRGERAQIVAVVEACRCGDLEQLVEALDVAEKAYDGLKRVFRALAKVEITSEEMRAGWLRLWLRDGDHIRQEVGDDLILIRALRVLLPRYRGPAMTLLPITASAVPTALHGRPSARSRKPSPAASGRPSRAAACCFRPSRRRKPSCAWSAPMKIVMARPNTSSTVAASVR